jgi:hypothetical protein
MNEIPALIRVFGVEKTREMAMENVNSAGTGASIDRVAAGRLFQHGQRQPLPEPKPQPLRLLCC